MPTLPTSRRALGWLTLSCLPLACTGAGGTPTPEPPDHLPKPIVVVPVFGQERFGSRATLAPTRLVGTVRPGEEAWVVDLDSPEVAPVRAAADADGAFEATLVGARDGDRIRVVARTATRHSEPADLRITGRADQPGSFHVEVPTPLACLTVSPADELTEVVETGATHARAFTLSNRCSEPVRVERAALRLAEQGIAVLPPSATVVPAGGEARLPVTFEGHDDPRERADVVLLDVAAGEQVGRYALGVYSVSASSLGKP